MATDRGLGMDLRNDTGINVVGLLKGPIGASRLYALELDRFPLDDDLAAEAVRGEVKLTRLRDGVMAKARVGGGVELECVRCLHPYRQAFATEFSEEYRQSVDVRTGLGLEPVGDEDEETSRIDENHELDLGEVLRQEILVALPMRPDCGEACPGPDAPIGAAVGADGAATETPFAALASLLDDDDPPARP